MLYETLWHAQDDDSNDALTLRSLQDPISLYSFENPIEKIVSEIDQNEFHIYYEEYCN